MENVGFVYLLITHVEAMQAPGTGGESVTPPSKRQNTLQTLPTMEALRDAMGLDGTQTDPMAASSDGKGTGSVSSADTRMDSLLKVMEQMVLMQQNLMAQQLQAATFAPAVLPPPMPLAAVRAATAFEPEDVQMETPSEPTYDRRSEKYMIKLPGNILAKMRAQGAILGKNLRALNRTKLHRKKLQGQVCEFDKGVIPAGMKPFKLPFDSPLFAKPIGDEFRCCYQASLRAVRSRRRNESYTWISWRLSLLLTCASKACVTKSFLRRARTRTSEQLAGPFLTHGLRCWLRWWRAYQYHRVS